MSALFSFGTKGVVIVGWAVFLNACGYQTVYGKKPFGLSTLALVPFAEEEAIGIAPDIAQELSVRLAAGGMQLVASQDAADGVLTGVVVLARTEASPIAGANTPSYGLAVLIRAQLANQKGVLWKKDLWVRDDYLPNRDRTNIAYTLATETNRRQALSRIAIKAAEELHRELLFYSATLGNPKDKG